MTLHLAPCHVLTSAERIAGTTLVTFLQRCAILLPLLLAGCVQVEQTLILNADGSGSLQLHYAAPLESVREMEEIARRAAAVGEEVDTPLDFNEETIREDFREYEYLGVALKDVDIEDRDGHRHVDLVIDFDSLSGLTATEFVSDRSLTLTKGAGGTFELRQASRRKDLDFSSLLDGAGGGAEEVMLQMLAGFRAKVRMRVPGDIVKTSGELDGGREASWVFEVSDVESLRKLQGFDLSVVFKGDGLDLEEIGIESDPAAEGAERGR